MPFTVADFNHRWRTFLMSGDKPAVIDFIGQTRVRFHDLSSSAEAIRAFTNINTPEDLRS